MNRRSVASLLVTAAAVFAFSAGPVAAAGSPTHAATRTAARAASAQPAGCTAGSKACPIRITFPARSYSAQRSAHMANINSVKWFVVNLHANQQVSVWVIGDGPTRGIVYF